MPEEWESVSSQESYSAESLTDEGFIHCSFANQLDGVIERYYSGVSELVVLEIDPKKLVSELKVEPSTADEEYPHIYGPLNIDAVVGMKVRKV